MHGSTCLATLFDATVRGLEHAGPVFQEPVDDGPLALAQAQADPAQILMSHAGSCGRTAWSSDASGPGYDMDAQADLFPRRKRSSDIQIGLPERTTRPVLLFDTNEHVDRRTVLRWAVALPGGSPGPGARCDGPAVHLFCRDQRDDATGLHDRHSEPLLSPRRSCCRHPDDATVWRPWIRRHPEWIRSKVYLATGPGGDRLALRIVEMIEGLRPGEVGGVLRGSRSCPG